jgi:hypothetical protein
MASDGKSLEQRASARSIALFSSLHGVRVVRTLERFRFFVARRQNCESRL